MALASATICSVAIAWFCWVIVQSIMKMPNPMAMPRNSANVSRVRYWLKSGIVGVGVGVGCPRTLPRQVNSTEASMAAFGCRVP